MRWGVGRPRGCCQEAYPVDVSRGVERRGAMAQPTESPDVGSLAGAGVPSGHYRRSPPVYRHHKPL